MCGSKRSESAKRAAVATRDNRAEGGRSLARLRSTVRSRHGLSHNRSVEGSPVVHRGKNFPCIFIQLCPRKGWPSACPYPQHVHRSSATAERNSLHTGPAGRSSHRRPRGFQHPGLPPYSTASAIGSSLHGKRRGRRRHLSGVFAEGLHQTRPVCWNENGVRRIPRLAHENHRELRH